MSSVLRPLKFIISVTLLQEEYFREGISWEAVDYSNNKVVCELIESKVQ